MLAPRRFTSAAPIVSIRPWQRLEQAKTILQELFADLYGSHPPVQPGATIVIKPNITANAPSSSGGTTQVKRGSPGVAARTGAVLCPRRRAFAGG